MLLDSIFHTALDRFRDHGGVLKGTIDQLIRFLRRHVVLLAIPMLPNQ